MTRIAGMPVVGFDDLVAGMVLAEAVCDQQGRLLMQAGTELTDRHLRAFQLWGILSVRIQAGDAEPGPADLPLSAEELAQGEAIVRGRLRETNPEHPLIAELIRICTVREARRLSQGGTHG